MEARYVIVMQIDARDAKTGVGAGRVETTAEIGPNDRNAILPCMIAAANSSVAPETTP